MPGKTTTQRILDYSRQSGRNIGKRRTPKQQRRIRQKESRRR